MGRAAAVAVVALAVVGAAGVAARAEQPAAPAPAPATAGAPLIALLLVPDPRLSIYGQPAAAELAGALERDGLAVVVVTSTSPVPARARLVIDARLVRGDGDAVVVEARVRDPATSKEIGAATASAPTLTRIDEAVKALARDLAAVLRDGLARTDPARRGRAGAPGGGDAARPDRGGGAAPAPARPADRRPLALVSVRSAAAAGPDDPALEPLLRAGAARLARLAGHRAGDLGPDDGAPAEALAARGAGLVVHVELLAIDYADRGVITARARARVIVTDPAGIVFDRVARTDTLVGGRGDRRDAVARAAIEQLVDVVAPRIRERLAGGAR